MSWHRWYTDPHYNTGCLDIHLDLTTKIQVEINMSSHNNWKFIPPNIDSEHDDSYWGFWVQHLVMLMLFILQRITEYCLTWYYERVCSWSCLQILGMICQKIKKTTQGKYMLWVCCENFLTRMISSLKYRPPRKVPFG